jgi:glycine/D-amino acid oxidase-like deaminating enzyme
VLEAETVGFGASGRNGGWCSALFPASSAKVAALPGSSREAALALHRHMRASVDEVLSVLVQEGIEAGARKGGTVTVARTPAQLRRLAAEVAEARDWGRGEDELALLDADEARRRLAADGVLGGTWTPDCAALHPLRLVRGLADAVERRGGTIHEGSRATALGPGRASTPHGTVRAEVVVRATEAWTPALPGSRRLLAPVYSLVVASDPLPAATWDAIGLGERETFTDGRHLIIYGQRTADDRLVLGGRGAPYHFASKVRPDFDTAPGVFAKLRRTAARLLPALDGVPLPYAWGGPLGIPRDWCASVGLDRETGLAWAGGYVGDGVSTSNLAGRTLRDLVLERRTELTALPWVHHRSRPWEPEPLRWLGVNAGLRAMALADVEEQLTRRPSHVARLMAPLVGGH